MWWTEWGKTDGFRTFLGASVAALVFVGCGNGCGADPPPTAPRPASAPAATSPPKAEAPPAGSTVTNLDPPEAQAARRRLVEEITRKGPPWTGAAWDPAVLERMRQVPRHRLMPTDVYQAYVDAPFPIGHGQTISQPTVVALMTQALDLSGKENVLEIGTGSGYQAAVLAGLCQHVYSIEIVEPLGLAAKGKLADLGVDNVTIRIGDGYAGWPEHAPFDRIILTAAPPTMPQALIDQLAPNGLIVAPVGDDIQRLVRWHKAPTGQLNEEDLGAVRFVPMVHGDRIHGGP